MADHQATRLKHFELIENTATRVPICLVVDTSGSMAFKNFDGVSRIERVKEGITAFFNEVENNVILNVASEIALIGFNNDAYQIFDFSPLGKINRDVEFKVGGTGNIGRAVELGLNKLEKRKKLYKEYLIDYHQPWIIIMSDGVPTGDGVIRELRKAQERTVALEESRSLTVLSVLITSDRTEERREQFDRKGYNYLKEFSLKNEPQTINNIEFVKFFEWLSQSVALAVKDDDYMSFSAFMGGKQKSDFDDL